MSDIDPNKELEHDDDFTREAEEEAPGIFREFVDFLANNKKWWLTPILIIMFLTAGLVILAGSGLAPLIYTIF